MRNYDNLLVLMPETQLQDVDEELVDVATHRQQDQESRQEGFES